MGHFFGVTRENSRTDDVGGALQDTAMGVSAGWIRAPSRHVRGNLPESPTPVSELNLPGLDPRQRFTSYRLNASRISGISSGRFSF